ncbi:MAG: hypothetical protein KatS3mg111_2471 [Pirellulaceae bacterium]|nr:MAG: hypothetical protein KatS3mg111_2471 [Pirellulaceae bacterium]
MLPIDMNKLGILLVPVHTKQRANRGTGCHGRGRRNMPFPQIQWRRFPRTHRAFMVADPVAVTRSASPRPSDLR